MRKNILLGLSMVLLLVMGVNADEILFSPDIPDGEKLIYREKENEKDSWGTFTDTVRKKQEQGEDVYIINSAGKDKLSMVLKTSNMKPIMVDSTYRYEKGIFSFKKKYTEKEVHIVSPEKKLDKTIKISKDTYDQESLFYVLRGLSFEINKMVKFNMFLTEPDEDEIRVLSMYATIISKEKTIVPAGEFICYKVEMGLTGIATLFYNEKFYYWFNVQKPHYLVKHSSTEGEIVELIKYCIK